MSKAKLKELYDRYQKDPKFYHLRADDINFVPGSGVLRPTAMLIGEAPGPDENARCIPFVGPAGAELNKILKKTDIDMSELYITNVVKYWTRLPSRRNRPPTEQETADSKSYLLEEIEIVNPSFVALLGRISTRVLFPNIPSIRLVNGKLLDKKYLPLYHPAAVLYKREKAEEIISGYKVLSSLIATLEDDNEEETSNY